jgi:DNA-binding CsgD family transcriptional regulator
MTVVDETSRRVVREALQALREAAIRIDKSRAEGCREEHTDAALAEWWALVRGRWSMVDRFDTDERRYVLALPNPPMVPNPRGLTEQEQQVTAFAALGDSHKLIAYRLGLSRSRVSHLLTSGMRKLGVKTQAQLVEKMGAFAVAEYQKRAGKG